MATLLDLRSEANRHLTHSDDVEYAMATTHAGMAHFAGTGPSGQTCRNCQKWVSEGWSSATSKFGGALKPARCQAYATMMQKAGPKIPHEARACKHFVQTDQERSIRDPRSR